jgi:hypothetical protein
MTALKTMPSEEQDFARGLLNEAIKRVLFWVGTVVTGIAVLFWSKMEAQAERAANLATIQAVMQSEQKAFSERQKLADEAIKELRTLIASAKDANAADSREIRQSVNTLTTQIQNMTVFHTEAMRTIEDVKVLMDFLNAKYKQP